MLCLNRPGCVTQVPERYMGVYSLDVFMERISRIIKEHAGEDPDAGPPLFLVRFTSMLPLL